jgi:hypothetical protein
MSKTEKLIVILIVLVVIAAGYWFYTRITKTNAEKQMERFQRALDIWKAKIKRAHTEKVPGWEGWYIPPGPWREKALADVHAAALWQIKLHQPELIPDGYEIAETTGGANGTTLGLLTDLGF